MPFGGHALSPRPRHGGRQTGARFPSERIIPVVWATSPKGGTGPSRASTRLVASVRLASLGRGDAANDGCFAVFDPNAFDEPMQHVLPFFGLRVPDEIAHMRREGQNLFRLRQHGGLRLNCVNSLEEVLIQLVLGLAERRDPVGEFVYSVGAFLVGFHHPGLALGNVEQFALDGVGAGAPFLEGVDQLFRRFGDGGLDVAGAQDVIEQD